ncbi:MAG: hypothetical protein JW953_09610 [Anaerolineae bacterium]|nr:hypothetical protein [Anaerolineae bacterium]
MTPNNNFTASQHIEGDYNAQASGPGAQATVNVTHIRQEAPARPPQPIPTEIPRPRASTFVGRSDELDWLCARLKAGDVAAVAGVRGIGGIGKTELAINAANQLKDHFGEHIIWLECGPNDVYAIQERIAAALGITLPGEELRLRADSLTLALRQRPATLVVLDDIRRRHLDEFACLLPPSPPCALLVTSRRDDLPLPDPAASIKKIDVLTPVQAETLLGNLLDPEDVPTEPATVTAICELLEKIPLALTLAARRAGRLARRRDADPATTLAALLADLQERRRVLVLEQGDRPDLSIMLTFEASYEELNNDDQARLQRLGVFARNEFELPALQAVWETDEEAARRTLLNLTNAGLLEEVDEDIWWMHDLLREYAAEYLGRQEQSEFVAVHLAYTAYWQVYLDNTELRSVADWRSLEAHRPEIEQAAEWLLTEWEIKPELAVELALSISQK